MCGRCIHKSISIYNYVHTYKNSTCDTGITFVRWSLPSGRGAQWECCFLLLHLKINFSLKISSDTQSPQLCDRLTGPSISESCQVPAALSGCHFGLVSEKFQIQHNNLLGSCFMVEFTPYGTPDSHLACL